MNFGIDFLQPEPSPRAGRWWLVAGAVAISASWLGYMASAGDLLSARVAIDDAQAKEALRRRPLPTMTPSADELRLRRSEEEVRTRWLATLRAVEGASIDPVYLRVLSLEPAAGTIRIEAEAPSFREALAYADALNDSDLLQRAMLSSHEQLPDGPNGKGAIRFQVTAQWKR